MYKPFKGGSEYVVGEGDLEIVVNIPPIGYIPIFNEKSGEYDLEKRAIISRSKTRKDQFWERSLSPKDYKRRRAVEKQKQSTDPNFMDSVVYKYESTEWDRRLNGVWFMNNGEPTYLTGLHYFFMTHWHISAVDTDYPFYRLPDKEWHYQMKYIEDDPYALGQNELTNRREGKTCRGGCWLYEGLSRTRNALGAIQSKTYTDAQKNVFGTHIILPFKKLPDFFRPQFDASQGDVPKSELRFMRASKKGKLTDEYEHDYDFGSELESVIETGSSEVFAFDGRKISKYLCDEPGKKMDVDVYDRHEVIAPTMMLGDKIIGKALYTTTFDDEENDLSKVKDSKRGFKELWKDSDQSKRDKNGRTITGLYRYFRPAYMTMAYDKYGNPDQDRALTYYNNRREALKDNPLKLAAEKRKFPFTWMEALRGLKRNCLYLEENLLDRMEALDLLDRPFYSVGNLKWKNGEPYTKVEFVENIGGFFQIDTRLFDEKYKGMFNQVKRSGSLSFPANKLKFVLGVDPYAKSKTVDGLGSKGAGAVYMKHDVLNAEISDNFVALYVGRPPKIRMFFADMIKLAWLFGCQMLHEDNYDSIKEHFEIEGMGAFIMSYEKKGGGITGNDKSHVQIVEETFDFIVDNCHRVIFDLLLKDWHGFDMYNTTEFDLGMASGYSLIGANKLKRIAKLIERSGQVEVKQLFRKYKVTTRHNFLRVA